MGPIKRVGTQAGERQQRQYRSNDGSRCMRAQMQENRQIADNMAVALYAGNQSQRAYILRQAVILPANSDRPSSSSAASVRRCHGREYVRDNYVGARAGQRSRQANSGCL